MTISLNETLIRTIDQNLRASNSAFMNIYPGETGRRQPVHTVYGGAHLFRSDTTVKLGNLAARAFRTYAPDVRTLQRTLDLPHDVAETVFRLIGAKLETEAVEDFRIDFEDGY